jgi:hypothetical protein
VVSQRGWHGLVTLCRVAVNAVRVHPFCLDDTLVLHIDERGGACCCRWL